MKRKLTTYILSCLLMPLLMTSCLYENPAITADGETGVDPTEVTLKANISLKFKMPTSTEEEDAVLERPTISGNPQYRHRFVVEAFHERVLAERQVIYEDIVDGRSEMTIPIRMKLHARNYEIAVWTDYVPVPNEKEGITGTEEFFYNTTSNHLLTVLGSEVYRGNNEYKDAFCGKAEIDLREYRNRWSAQANISMELTRPVARYELVANDVAKFLKRIETGTVKGESFTVRLKYNAYLNIGYNVLERLPRHGLMYLQYDKVIRTRDLKPEENLPLMFDYVFANNKEASRIPVTLDIIDGEKKLVASTTFNIIVRAGLHFITTHNFLTSNPDDGIHFDPSYDEEIEVNVPGDLSKNKYTLNY